MNEISNDNSTYSSKDFYLSSCILASGIKLLRLQKETEKIVFFVFAISPAGAEEIIKKHWSRELLIPTRNIVDAIHELKTRIFSRS